MEREHHCKDCGFDLSKLEMTVLYAGRGVEGARRRLFCPICRGGPIELAAERLVFPRTDANWVRWREAGTSSVPNVIQVGRLKLRIDARVDTLSADQVCFRSVPVFHSEGGKVWPALPVLPEFLDCLDGKQLEIAQQFPERFGRVVQEGSKARYRSLIPLRGLRETEWPTVECDVMPANPQTSVTADADQLAFRGISLRIWPNLQRPTPDWKYYVAWVGATSEEGTRLFSAGRAFRSRMFVSRANDGGFVEVPLDLELGREGEQSVTAMTGASAIGRPSWVSTEFRRADGEPMGGGLFALKPPSPEAQLSGECSLGLDFGTTNTVVAVRRADGAIDCIAPSTNTTLYLVNSGAPSMERGADLWPGGPWSGPHHDILPSELGSIRRWTDIASRERIDSLIFGRDFGVPIRGAKANLPPEQVVSEFKWLRAVQKEKSALAHQDVVEGLQSRFLEAAMMMSMASILSESASSPKTVTVYYSYPLAFEDQDLRTLEKACVAAEKRLKLLTGTDFKFLELMDEAQAAVGTTGPNKMFRVCVDLGGGSLEVLVDDTWSRNGKLGHEGFHPHVFSTSLFFGGSVYLRSLLGSPDAERRSSCVLPAMSSYTRLASEVRRWESGRTLIESPDIIAEARKGTAVRRARVFVGYIVELVARVLAGVCLEHGRTRDEALDFSRNRLFTLTTVGNARRWVLGTPAEGSKRKIEFSLVLLGNGWGFADIVRDGKSSVEEMISQRVRIRLLELLKSAPITQDVTDGSVSLASALEDDPDARLLIEVSAEPPSGNHRKARVARGLLEAQDQPQNAHGFETRANGRHGVQGFDVLLADSGREIPWYRPFGSPARDKPELMQSVPVVKASEPVVNGMPATSMAMPAPSVMPMQPRMPSAATTPAPSPSTLGTLESFVWMLTQQWSQVTAAAAQHAISPLEFAGRQLWGQVISSATLRNETPEQWLAAQRWEQVMRGTPAEMLSVVHAQRWDEITSLAAQQSQTPHALLAAQRWDELMTLLARSIPMTFGALPPAPPFPFEPRTPR